ncbi:ribosome maturation factor RimM [Mycoplasmatota bacterium]|nr:ribosome maturation factor RimM [Mycoplasmatota bacterium]
MSEYYVIGTIVSTHALKGEVKIYSTTDFRVERYQVGNTLYIKKDNQMIEVIIKSYRPHKDYELVSFENYNDINTVLPLVKCKIYVGGDNVQSLDEDEYYYRELFNCSVYHEDQLIGKVVDVVNYGASDILIIQDEKNKEVMIPFVNDFILEVDTEKRKIQIEVIEGLLHHED